MSNVTSTGKSDSASNVPLRDSGGAADSCISDQVATEIVQRFYGEVDLDQNTGIHVGTTSPGDISKIWFEQNGTGTVTNIKFYNSTTGQWEDVLSTSDEGRQEELCESDNAIERLPGGCIRVQKSTILANSTNSDNIIGTDDQGNLIVSEVAVRQLVANLDASNQCNVLQRSTDGEISVDRGANGYIHIGTGSGFIQGVLIEEGVVNLTTQTFDLSGISGLPSEIDWDNCPPTHIQVTAVISIKNGSTYSGGSWTTPAIVVEAGVDATRVAMQVDADAAEGTDFNTAVVRLNPANPKILSYRLAENTGAYPMDWTDIKNHLGLYAQALIWGGPITP